LQFIKSLTTLQKSQYGHTALGGWAELWASARKAAWLQSHIA